LFDGGTMEITFTFHIPEDEKEMETFSNAHSYRDFFFDLNHYFLELTNELNHNSNFSPEKAAKRFWDEYMRIRDEIKIPYSRI
jgi:hypothetical protein